MTKPAEQRCRQCGCTNDRACALALGARCYWVMPDLCSNPSCLFADPRTPPLEIFGPEKSDFDSTCPHAGLAVGCLLRPLGGDETVPAIGDPNNSLRADSRTPPLEIFGPEKSDFDSTCPHAGLAVGCLLRPLGGDETIPAIGDPNNSLRSATPAPGPLMQPLLERLPLQWLLRLVFLDPGVNAVEVHPWIRSTSHLDRAVNRVGGLRLCRRRGRVFVRRWAPESKGGSK